MAKQSSKNTGDRPVGDAPAITENQWYILAVTSAVLTAVAIVCGFLWVFGDGFDGSGDLQKAQALSPFGVALFAVVTFCTAGWRGSINTRQANQSENEGRAKLLQEGAKLLAEDGKAAHVSAGIATLAVLVSGTDKSYGLQAMNLLADYVEDHMRHGHSNRHRPQISGVMRAGDANGVNTDRHISFSYESDDRSPDDETAYWNFIPGFKLISYYGGVFDYDPHYDLDELYGVEFQHVGISNWHRLDIDHRFHRCRFSNCGISSLVSMMTINDASDFQFAFDTCDFSGCEIHESELLQKNLKRQGNYYFLGNPPILLGSDSAVDWPSILDCVKVRPKREWPF